MNFSFVISIYKHALFYRSQPFFRGIFLFVLFILSLFFLQFLFYLFHFLFFEPSSLHLDMDSSASLLDSEGMPQLASPYERIKCTRAACRLAKAMASYIEHPFALSVGSQRSSHSSGAIAPPAIEASQVRYLEGKLGPSKELLPAWRNVIKPHPFTEMYSTLILHKIILAVRIAFDRWEEIDLIMRGKYHGDMEIPIYVSGLEGNRDSLVVATTTTDSRRVVEGTLITASEGPDSFPLRTNLRLVSANIFANETLRVVPFHSSGIASVRSCSFLPPEAKLNLDALFSFDRTHTTLDLSENIDLAKKEAKFSDAFPIKSAKLTYNQAYLSYTQKYGVSLPQLRISKHPHE